MGNYLWPVAGDVSVDIFVVSGRLTYVIRVCTQKIQGQTTFQFYNGEFPVDELCKIRDCIESGADSAMIQSSTGRSIYVQDGALVFTSVDVRASYPVEWFRGTFPRIIQLLGYEDELWADISAPEFGETDLEDGEDTDAGDRC